MWRRYIRNLSIEFRWMKRDFSRRWKFNKPISVVGILTLISGIILLFVIGSGISNIFRAYIPWVSGSRMGEVYWQSIGFGIKTSLTFLIFIILLVSFLLLNFTKRR